MNNKDHFEILRKLDKNTEFSQRELAKELGFSLGKLNYCLKALQKKGLIKLKNFQKKNNKIKFLRYLVTPKGFSERTKLTINFMKQKIKEYDELKKELKQNKEDLYN
jgi:EPS-associated MarR family transcriptional regulator|tara:strand:+ start:2650 stop:2970 length:321 start_codon:yes stop_codon:yes gene_type:complete